MVPLSKKGIRVLYIHGVAQIGGAERELLTWLKVLDRTRFHPYIVCPSDGPLAFELSELEIPHISLYLPAWRKLLQVLYRPMAILRLVRVMQRWNIDVLHVNDYWWAPIGVLASRLRGCPCLVHVRQEIETRKVKQYWLDKASMVLPVSESIGNVIRDTGISEEKVQVLLSGISKKAAEPSPPSRETSAILKKITGQPIIGTVANLFPRKGLEYLVQAVGNLKESFDNILLVIVGTGDAQYESQLRKQIQDLNLTQHVLFTEFQEYPELFVSQFDVFVLPSIQEGFGIVLLEAMALGKPIVASNVGGIPEIVQHEKTGILVKAADVEELSKGVLTLLNDPNKRRKMGEQAQKRAAEYFSVERMMERLYGLYEDVLAKR
jgi:glycosyltransferase involved in cell wall biosynthesis